MELDVLVAERLRAGRSAAVACKRTGTGNGASTEGWSRLSPNTPNIWRRTITFHLDGFIRFRLGDYRLEVIEAAETAMEDRLKVRQYEAFMDMLKSLVDLEHIGIAVVHVLHAGGHAFRLLDEDMRPLDREDEGEDPPAPAEEEESLLVSRLLAVAPGQLHIHTPEPDSQVIRTLIGIFANGRRCIRITRNGILFGYPFRS